MSERAQKCLNNFDNFIQTVYCFQNDQFLLFQIKRNSRFSPKQFYYLDCCSDKAATLLQPALQKLRLVWTGH